MEQLATSEFSGATDVWDETLCLEVEPGKGCTLSSRSHAVIGSVYDLDLETDEDGAWIVPDEIDGEAVWREGEFVVCGRLEPHTDESIASFEKGELLDAAQWLQGYGWAGVPEWADTLRRLREVLGGNTTKGAVVSVRWGNELHSLGLRARNWSHVLSGKALKLRGKGYRYEGEFYWDYWSFGGGLEGELVVTYGDESAVGFDGMLIDADIEES